MCIHTYVSIYVSIYVGMRVCGYVCMCVRCVCVYVCTLHAYCVYIHVCLGARSSTAFTDQSVPRHRTWRLQGREPMQPDALGQLSRKTPFLYLEVHG